MIQFVGGQNPIIPYYIILLQFSLIFTNPNAFSMEWSNRAGLTIWWALRTTQRRGPNGRLEAEERERGEEGYPGLSPSPAN